jgi:hypothetical protein
MLPYAETLVTRWKNLRVAPTSAFPFSISKNLSWTGMPPTRFGRPFRAILLCSGFPGLKARTLQSDSTELAEVLGRGRSIGRIDYSPRARRSAAKAA